MSAERRRLQAVLPLDRIVFAGVLALLACFYVYSALHVRWTGDRWWERAAYETAHGRNIYGEDYAIWLTHSEAEPFFGYGAGILYGTVPLYLAARAITGSEGPDLFAQMCVVWAAAAQVGLVLAGARIVRQQSGSRGAATAAAAVVALNPILLRLGAMGDVVDLTMLFLCSLYLMSMIGGRFRSAGVWLSLAFLVKQFPMLLLPDWLIRVYRARRLDAVAWCLLPLIGLSLPYLVWSPKEYLFIVTGNVNAWRAIYRGEWWNVFAFLAGSGVPEAWLRALSLGLLVCAEAVISWAALRTRLTVLAAWALMANAFWMLYHSPMATYIGWGSTFAAIALGSAWRGDREAW